MLPALVLSASQAASTRTSGGPERLGPRRCRLGTCGSLALERPAPTDRCRTPRSRTPGRPAALDALRVDAQTEEQQRQVVNRPAERHGLELPLAILTARDGGQRLEPLRRGARIVASTGRARTPRCGASSSGDGVVEIRQASVRARRRAAARSGPARSRLLADDRLPQRRRVGHRRAAPPGRRECAGCRRTRRTPPHSARTAASASPGESARYSSVSSSRAARPMTEMRRTAIGQDARRRSLRRHRAPEDGARSTPTVSERHRHHEPASRGPAARRSADARRKASQRALAALGSSE